MPPERIVGESIAALLEQIRRDLGPDAMILEVRKISTAAGPRYQALAVGAAGYFVSPPAATASVPSRAGEPGSRRHGGLLRTIRILQGGKKRPTSAEGLAERIALVGPTGAGKTTTLAKLAHHPRAFGGRSVGLLCLDTFRIGAVEQSHIYAQLSNLPLEVVYDPGELSPALHRLQDREVLLIDTAGRGPLARNDREATRGLLNLLNPTEVHLVLPAGIRPAFARQIVTEHRPLGITHLLPTKVDECPDDDWLFHLAARTGLPIRWVAGGHRVPDDLFDASAEGGWDRREHDPYAAFGVTRGTA